MHIALISCSKDKHTRPGPAEEVYAKSTLFAATRTYVKAAGYDAWFIMSAKYGILAPQDTISPYELALSDLTRDAQKDWAEKAAFATRHIAQLRLGITAAAGGTIDLFGGALYTRYLLGELARRGFEVNQPLAGLQVGERKRWLKEHIAELAA